MQLACEYRCSSISAIANPSYYIRAHKLLLHPCLYASELGQQGKMVVTSPQNAATIGWEYDRGTCLDHLSECFATASAKQTIQEWARPVGNIGDPILDVMTPNYAHVRGSPLLSSVAWLRTDSLDDGTHKSSCERGALFEVDLGWSEP